MLPSSSGPPSAFSAWLPEATFVGPRPGSFSFRVILAWLLCSVFSLKINVFFSHWPFFAPVLNFLKNGDCDTFGFLEHFADLGSPNQVEVSPDGFLVFSIECTKGPSKMIVISLSEVSVHRVPAFLSWAPSAFGFASETPS